MNDLSRIAAILDATHAALAADNTAAERRQSELDAKELRAILMRLRPCNTFAILTDHLYSIADEKEGEPCAADWLMAAQIVEAASGGVDLAYGSYNALDVRALALRNFKHLVEKL